MQEVYRDGSFGDVLDFKAELLKELVKKPNVDHVRVFKKETGGQVGIIDIEDAQFNKRIQTMVNQAVEERSDRDKVMAEYKALTGRE